MELPYSGGNKFTVIRPLTTRGGNAADSPVESPLPSCRSCGTELTGRQLWVTERQLGIGGDFDYRECAKCGAISITAIPADLEKYYGARYYSFKSAETPKPPTGWRAWAYAARAELATSTRLERSARRTWKQLELPYRARILDVGCGDGKWLRSLDREGYQNLQGIDAFLNPEIENTARFPLQRKKIEEMNGGWDLIAYHHVLEHIADPQKELAEVRDRLGVGGSLLLRVPVADSWARRRFGVSWLQWDAPRHLWLPTRKSLHGLAARIGFTIEYQVDDSVSFPIWASRGYQLGHTGFDHSLNPEAGSLRMFIPKGPRTAWMWLFSAWLNFRNQGDQVTMIWRKTN